MYRKFGKQTFFDIDQRSFPLFQASFEARGVWQMDDAYIYMRNLYLLYTLHYVN